ncbi:hypothetical protein BGLA2_190023 [Burkholderia gladioli]|nr:hypothetical protein BGLA2_190023 [Burkholderia gladioli]
MVPRGGIGRWLLGAFLSGWAPASIQNLARAILALQIKGLGHIAKFRVLTRVLKTEGDPSYPQRARSNADD